MGGIRDSEDLKQVQSFPDNVRHLLCSWASPAPPSHFLPTLLCLPKNASRGQSSSSCSSPLVLSPVSPTPGGDG